MIKKNLILFVTGLFSIIVLITIIIIVVHLHNKNSKNSKENYCNASGDIQNGVASPCTSSLPDGDTCYPTCTPPYTLSGNRLCKNDTLVNTAYCIPKTIPSKKHGPPTPEQLELVKTTVTGYSNLFSDEPFIMFVNYTNDIVLARIGSGTGNYPCSDDNRATCDWGKNPGISKVHILNGQINKQGFDTGINKSHQILNPNECWLIKIPLDPSGYLNFCVGNNDATGAISCKASQNLYFAYGLTGKYFDVTGKKYDSYTEAKKSIYPDHQLFPECESNSNTNLAVGQQSQLELHLAGLYSATDLSSVNGVSNPLYIAMYDSKTGNDFTCTYPAADGSDNKRNFLYCDYDRQNCEFPQIDDKTYQIKRDKDGLPYNCVQPGIACQYYVKNVNDHNFDFKSLWGGDLDAKFTFTDPHGTTWNTKGCVPDNNYCTEVNGKLQYMGMDLQGGSCELLNAGGLRLNYKTKNEHGNDNDNWIDWTSGGVPQGNLSPAITKDPIWNKYQPECQDNFGSISDRLRMCNYDIQKPKGDCPVSKDGSCRTDNGKGNKDSWSSSVVQRFCESCHSDTCTTYCQAYDDHWGTMICPLIDNQTRNPLRPNVVVITY
jgi:hypothetical protein